MTPLFESLKRRITQHGPISVADYMQEVLLNPVHGYYTQGDPFGAPQGEDRPKAGGDFVTAPEISQMFGELIGLWVAEHWIRSLSQKPASSQPVILMELGPGRGTLMDDVLRSIEQVAPTLFAKLHLHMIEASPFLQSVQQKKLEGWSLPKFWSRVMPDVRSERVYILANEFFDALPIRQFLKTHQGWAERLIAVSPQGDDLIFTLSSPSPLYQTLIPASLQDIPPGALVEVSPASLAYLDQMAASLYGGHGAGLIIDYGYSHYQSGDTLQALRRHKRQDPLVDPQSADLTAHVNFAALGDRASACGLNVYGPMAQGSFLKNLGIDARAQRLARTATPDQQHDIESAHHRLTSGDEMGHLFKVMALCDPDSLPPAGFPVTD